jgi:DNA-binding beta-propeller fold protein YncE
MVGSNGTLYVADTLANRIAAISNAFSRMSDAHTGQTVLSGNALNGPLGLTIAPNSDIVVANANDGNMVEVSPSGHQVAFKNVDLTGAGAGTLFGLEITPNGKGIYYVNDGDNTLDVLK